MLITHFIFVLWHN